MTNPRRDKLEHWIVEHEQSGARPVVVWFKAAADDYRARDGYTVRGPFVAASEVERLRQALTEIHDIAHLSTERSWRNVPCEEIWEIARTALEAPDA